MKKKRYPITSKKRTLTSALSRGRGLIKKKLGKEKLTKLRNIERKHISGKTSLSRNTRNGRLKPSRKRLHNRIIKKQFRKKGSIDRKDPDLYIFGGLPASGKTTVLAKKVPEKTIVIDSDGYKGKLSKHSKSPMKGFKLAHAGLLHDEADLLVNRAVNKAIKQKRNVTYDATMKSLDKGKKLIQKFKKAGYDVHYLSTQKKPSTTLVHASKRFLKSGRYVSLDYIKTYGNQISKNSWKAKKYGDTYQVYDTNSIKKPKLVSKSKKSMKHNFRNP